MNALIIYDDFAYAVKAKEMLERAAHRADAALHWIIKLWRVDLLKLPAAADVALAEAADAHLILFGLRNPRSIPAKLQSWLEQWAVGRHVQEAALALWDSGTDEIVSASVAPELSQFAKRNGLGFIFGGGDRRPATEPPKNPGNYPGNGVDHIPIYYHAHGINE